MHAGQASQHCVDQGRLHGAANAGTEDARGADQGLCLVLAMLLCVVPAMLLMLLMLPVLHPMLPMVVICMPAAMAALLLRLQAALAVAVAARLLLVVVATHGLRRLRLLCDEGA